MKNKPLQIWNGRGFSRWVGEAHEHYDHVFVCAHSVADAVRVLKEAGYRDISRHEINVYYAEGCWGTTMEGITPERGVWVTVKNGDRRNPIRLI